jgi:hypothetical protein
MNFVGTTFGGNAVYLCPVCGDKRFFSSSLLNSVVETNGDCFVACAVYGSFDAPQVVTLRTFRDRFLVHHSAGRAFVWGYYRFGPVAAKLTKLSGSKGQKAVRWALDRLVSRLKRDYGI